MGKKIKLPKYASKSKARVSRESGAESQRSSSGLMAVEDVGSERESSERVIKSSESCRELVLLINKNNVFNQIMRTIDSQKEEIWFKKAYKQGVKEYKRVTDVYNKRYDSLIHTLFKDQHHEVSPPDDKLGFHKIFLKELLRLKVLPSLSDSDYDSRSRP